MKEAGEFAAMYRMWWHVVREAADNVLQSEADARDAAQQVFVRLWESGDWRRIDDPERFFVRAGRNEALTVLRRRRRRRELLSADTRSRRLRGPIPSPDEARLRSERRDHLLQLIERLPQRCRLVAALSLVDGFTRVTWILIGIVALCLVGPSRVAAQFCDGYCDGCYYDGGIGHFYLSIGSGFEGSRLSCMRRDRWLQPVSPYLRGR